MPELPEVETIRSVLSSVIKGKTIDDVEVFHTRTIETNLEDFTRLIKGKTIFDVTRKGKLLTFVLSDGFKMTSHLRMEGKYFYQDVPEPKQKHDMLRFRFVDGGALVYNDVRKFGRIGLYTEEEYQTSSSYASLGPEPFDINPEEFAKGLIRRRGTVKEAIMDQAFVAGIGNIYADEALFAAKINPKTSCKHLTLEQGKTLLLESRRILNEAISSGGSTIRSYHPGKGIDGMFQVRLKAYGKANEPCPTCGFPLKRTLVGQRGTTYCPICQAPNHAPFVLGVTGPIHSGKSTASQYFESKGYVRFDADHVAKKAYQDKEIKKCVVKLLGKAAYEESKPNSGYIRVALANNPKLKKRLESIIHPYVIQKAKELITSMDKGKVVLDVPLLFPSRMDDLCDATVLVISDLGKQRDRLREEGRDADALMKLNSAWPMADALRNASFVVRNDAGVDELYQGLDALPLP